MSDEITEAVQGQERLHEILLGYVEAAQAGAAPDRLAFLAAHPEFAADIVEFLASYHQLNRMVTPLREGDAPGPEPAAPGLYGPLEQTRSTEAPGVRRDSAIIPELGQLGDYRLLREIGRGGMGVVYEVEQISLRRRVALKILPFAGGVDARQLQRFRNEAEAAAHLHHSHIVPVFAVGSERGVHFYAMQFIEGQSLASLITDLRGGKETTEPQQGEKSAKGSSAVARSPDRAIDLGLPRSPDRAPTEIPTASSGAKSTQTVGALSTKHSARTGPFFQTVATIGKQTAEALEYAHQMGVIHRDVKPANLLLDARGEVWITDFGLAQFQNQVGLTMTGEVLGTLRYVSPEQAMAKRGLVDHHTDIYSLGATLYELLTLKPVFDGRDRHALLQQIGFDEPTAPRALDPSIPFELETIVLKALAKNPAERYGTAQELADDLQRFLEDKPIQAKRPSVVERARKWGRRHPAVVFATVLLLVFGVNGLAVSTALIAREQAKTKAAYESEKIQQGKTQAAYEAEKKRAQEAEQRFQLARRSADEMVRLAEGELSGNPAMLNLRRQLLEAALVYYEEFIELRRENPGSKAELASTRDRVKSIVADLAVLQGAGQPFLLKKAPVLSDINVSKAQRTRIGDLLKKWDKEWQDKFRGFGLLDAEERQKRFVDMARSNEAAIAEILEPAQLRRFQQIVVQCKGPMAFREPEIASTLKLTAEQKNQIRAIDANLDFERHGGPPGSSSRQAQEDKRKSAMKQILKVLTPEQEKQWRELTGEPFTSSEPIFLPAGPPRDWPAHKGPAGKGAPSKGAPPPI
jgi:eukaryotic-like serine/threonine-protein kinase